MMLIVVDERNEITTEQLNRLKRIWQRASKVRQGIIQQHQELRLDSAIQEEIDVATQRRTSLVNLAEILNGRELSYR